MLLVCTIVLSAIVVLLSCWKHDGATLRRWLVLGCLAWASILVFLWYSMAPRLAVGGLDQECGTEHAMECGEQIHVVATACSAHGNVVLGGMWVTCATLGLIAWLATWPDGHD